MELTPLDCARVEEQEYGRLYVEGALSEAEAEAFEAHYFGCDRCWAAVERAVELRAAFTHGVAPVASFAAGHTAEPGEGRTPQRASAVRGRATVRWWRRAWVPALAAAALVMISVWQLHRSRGQSVLLDVERGASTDVVVRPAVTQDTLVATWSPVRGADQYRVQLFAADGTQLAERTVSDTMVSVPRDVLAAASAGSSGGTAYWSVEALDATRHSLAKSRLTAASTTRGR
jgi:anti-sigma factor RsiW